MAKKIFIGLGVFLGILALFAIFVAMQPDEVTVERSTTVAAPPQVVFDQVNNFHKWQAWSPWAKLDPAAKNTFEGPDSGEGARFSWAGNDQVGEGRMAIAESQSPEHIKIDLEFIKPFPAKNVTLFKFTPEGDGTKVTWNMSGTNNFVGKAICLFMNMDTMVGGDFEKGLAEAEANGAPSAESKPADAAAPPAEPSTEPAASRAPATEPGAPTEPSTEPANP